MDEKSGQPGPRPAGKRLPLALLPIAIVGAFGLIYVIGRESGKTGAAGPTTPPPPGTLTRAEARSLEKPPTVGSLGKPPAVIPPAGLKQFGGPRATLPPLSPGRIGLPRAPLSPASATAVPSAPSGTSQGGGE